MPRDKRTRWIVIGACGLLTAVAVYAIRQSLQKRTRVRDPKVEKVRELIAEADQLLHHFR